MITNQNVYDCYYFILKKTLTEMMQKMLYIVILILDYNCVYFYYLTYIKYIILLYNNT